MISNQKLEVGKQILEYIESLKVLISNTALHDMTQKMS